MLKIKEFEEIYDISHLLSSVLNFPRRADIPPDVTEAIRAAKKQMEDLPAVLEDLNAAFDRYLVLKETLSRMSELAAAAATDESDAMAAEERFALDAEFGQLARVIALEAGQAHFQGTSLSLLSPQLAKAAAKVLSYLKPVLENLDHDLRGQKTLVIDALAETINFMGVVARCYPELPGVDSILSALEKVKFPATLNEHVTVTQTIH
ncbi:MAG: hypothetical protein LBO66_01465 [Deltaproteobacteria bacterium]|jgi:hypothetical protein|nr:hypothetical protein [Deltaproteobacteria bacterium]